MQFHFGVLRSFPGFLRLLKSVFEAGTLKSQDVPKGRTAHGMRSNTFVLVLCGDDDRWRNLEESRKKQIMVSGLQTANPASRSGEG